MGGKLKSSSLGELLIGRAGGGGGHQPPVRPVFEHEDQWGRGGEGSAVSWWGLCFAGLPSAGGDGGRHLLRVWHGVAWHDDEWSVTSQGQNLVMGFVLG